VRDSDCGGGGNICVCADPVGQCALSSCSSGKSCFPGCDCVTLPFSSLHPTLGLDPTSADFACQTPADQCITNADCGGIPIPAAGTLAPNGCAYAGGPAVCSARDAQGVVGNGFSCEFGVLDCRTGRPFLVRGIERVGDCVGRGDWRSPNIAPDLRACSRPVLARLATHWIRVGLMEHASIAAFARFTLHLLAVGAPPELVSSSQRAIGDETEHARLAFALASAYAGAEMGPGPLAIDGSLDSFHVVDLVATLVREGCIGETVAAIEASDALASAVDPVVRMVLETVARDELRHAELAWRTLGWLVASGRANRATVQDEVALALRQVESSPRRTEAGDDLAAFGVISDARRDELRQAAATRVIRRCADALLRRESERPTAC
jgi:hypothetical protein